MLSYLLWLWSAAAASAAAELDSAQEGLIVSYAALKYKLASQCAV